MKTKQYSCPAEKLIDTSTVIKVNGFLVPFWNLESIADLKEMEEGDGVCFDFDYTDDEWFDYITQFSVKALENAIIKDNLITLIDIEGEEVQIQCFSLIPNVLVNPDAANGKS